MSVTRKNILTDTAARDAYINGVKLLKAEDSGFTTTDFGIPGPSRSISTYDLFVVWHYQAMNQLTPPGNAAGRNRAHRGPVFLPWHRVMLILLEANLQRVLSDATFGLPYWDWATDGELSDPAQPTAPIWGNAVMGGSGNPVATGPFAFNAADPNSFRVRIEINFANALRSTNRGLRRSLAATPPAGVQTLPKIAEVSAALTLTPYDDVNWDAWSAGFRNRAEGWDNPAGGPGLHNRVHVFIGGDMSPSTSPNDPVFYLNHCNVDRIWEGWLSRNGLVYLPNMSAGTFLTGHRINDPIASPLASTMSTPGQVLDVSTIYTYDLLP